MIIHNPVDQLKQMQRYYVDMGIGYLCSVCAESYLDIDKHLNKFNEYNHAGHEEKLKLREVDECFCGGLIITHSNEDSWSLDCNQCGFLVDED